MEYFAVLAPTVGVALIFYYVIRAIVRSDRNERAALERYYAEEAEAARRAAERTPGEGETRR